MNYCIQSKLGYDLNNEVCPAIVATNYKEPPMLLRVRVGESGAPPATASMSSPPSTVASGKDVPPNSTEGGGTSSPYRTCSGQTFGFDSYNYQIAKEVSQTVRLPLGADNYAKVIRYRK